VSLKSTPSQVKLSYDKILHKEINELTKVFQNTIIQAKEKYKS